MSEPENVENFSSPLRSTLFKIVQINRIICVIPLIINDYTRCLSTWLCGLVSDRTKLISNVKFIILNFLFPLSFP